MNDLYPLLSFKCDNNIPYKFLCKIEKMASNTSNNFFAFFYSKLKKWNKNVKTLL